MDRRSLLKTLIGVGAASVAAPSVHASKHKYGFLDVKGHTAHSKTTGEFLRVSVNGVDVTDRCCEADDIDGYVIVFCHDRQEHHWDVEQGAKHVSGQTGSACRHRIDGDVVIAPGHGPTAAA
jgi:hypothetical protein